MGVGGANTECGSQCKYTTCIPQQGLRRTATPARGMYSAPSRRSEDDATAGDVLCLRECLILVRYTDESDSRKPFLFEPLRSTCSNTAANCTVTLHFAESSRANRARTHAYVRTACCSPDPYVNPTRSRSALSNSAGTPRPLRERNEGSARGLPVVAANPAANARAASCGGGVALADGGSDVFTAMACV